MKMPISSVVGVWLVLLTLAWPMQAAEVAVQVENLAPEGGVYLSPMWVGFDGPQFRLFTTVGTGTPSDGLTQLATQGDASLLEQEFKTAVPNGVQGIVNASQGSPNAPNFAPGATGKTTFDLDPGTNRFMDFAAKVYPGTSAFIASSSPIEVFDAQGQFKGKQIITVLGSEVLEAPTSSAVGSTSTRAAVLSARAAALTIAGGNTGSNAAAANGGTLPGVTFDPVASDLTLPGAVVARITIVPEPATLFLLAGGSLMLLRRRRHAGPK